MSEKTLSSIRKLSWWTQAYGAVLLLRAFLYLGAYGPESIRSIFRAANAAQIWLLVAQWILGLAWLYTAWRRVPEPCRRTYDNRKVEPSEAVWKLFIPFYGFYWLFVANIGLCSALERHAKQVRLQRNGPSSFALVTCLVQLVPLVGLLLAPLFWFTLMFRIDLLHAEVEAME